MASEGLGKEEMVLNIIDRNSAMEELVGIDRGEQHREGWRAE